MAAQSFAMGDAFGTSFQYGKRKISSLSNDEFNALTMVGLHDTIQHDIRDMIPAMNDSFKRMQEFQIDIIQSMLQTLLLGIQEFGKFVTGGLGSSGGGTTTDTPEPSFGGTVVEDITFGLLPPAFGDTGDSGSGTGKKGVEYYAEALKLPFKILLSIVKKFGSNPSLKVFPPAMRWGYKKAFFEMEAAIKAKKKTPEEAIEIAIPKDSIIKKIAVDYQVIVKLAAQIMKAGGTKKSKLIKLILKLAKKYNQYVAANGFPKMQIDTKFLLKGTVMPKFK